jgi:hypothetical protein
MWYQTKAMVERRIEKSKQLRSNVHKSDHYQKVQTVKEYVIDEEDVIIQ